MNDKHRSNADVHVPETRKDGASDKARDARKDDVPAEDHADDTVEQETEDTFRDAEELPQEDSA